MSYFLKVRDSIEFIEDNLNQPLKMAQIADNARLSQYHFHRVFLAITGITAIDYLRRRRLSSAAFELLETEREIIQIAFDYDFESQESFTRAFKKQFEITPAKFRKGRQSMVHKYQLKIELGHYMELKGARFMNPQIKIKDEFKIIGISRNMIFKQPNEIPQLWEELNSRVKEIRSLKQDGNAFGLCIQSKEKDGNFEYIACFEADDFSEIPEGMTTKIIPASKYAVFTVKGVQNIPQTFQFIYGDWAGKSEYELANSPDFELYDERSNPQNPLESEIDIYIPIK